MMNLPLDGGLIRVINMQYLNDDEKTEAYEKLYHIQCNIPGKVSKVQFPDNTSTEYVYESHH